MKSILIDLITLYNKISIMAAEAATERNQLNVEYEITDYNYKGGEAKAYCETADMIFQLIISYLKKEETEEK